MCVFVRSHQKAITLNFGANDEQYQSEEFVICNQWAFADSLADKINKRLKSITTLDTEHTQLSDSSSAYAHGYQHELVMITAPIKGYVPR